MRAMEQEYNFRIVVNELEPQKICCKCKRCNGKGAVGVYNTRGTAGYVKMYDECCDICGGRGYIETDYVLGV